MRGHAVRVWGKDFDVRMYVGSIVLNLTVVLEYFLFSVLQRKRKKLSKAMIGFGE